MLLGSRHDESQQRSKTIKKYLKKDNQLSIHSTLENCKIFMPIVDILIDDLWEMIGTFKTHWGDDYSQLIQLYKDALGGECPVILSKDDTPSCGNKSARFGCWVCTVVQKDKSLEGLHKTKANKNFESLINFRIWLMAFASKKENQIPLFKKWLCKKKK